MTTERWLLALIIATAFAFTLGAITGYNTPRPGDDDQ